MLVLRSSISGSSTTSRSFPDPYCPPCGVGRDMTTCGRLDWGFPGGTSGKAPSGDTRDKGSVPGWGRSLGGGQGDSLHYSCLENPMDGGDYWTAVHGEQRVGLNWSDLAHSSLGSSLETFTPSTSSPWKECTSTTLCWAWPWDLFGQ